MHTRLVILAWVLTALCAPAQNADYVFEVVSVVVTPRFLTENKIPFQFAIAEADGGMMGVSVDLELLAKESGHVTSCDLLIYNMVPPSDGVLLDKWVLGANRARTVKKVVKVAVPSDRQKLVHRLILVTPAELERSVLSVHYARPGYGGDVYWVILGQFAPQVPAKPGVSP